MCFSSWVSKATGTHSEYAIFIAFPGKQWLRERSSMLRYTYISCLHIILFIPCIYGDRFIIINQPMQVLVQGDQKFSVHLMITVRTLGYLAQFDCLASDRQSQGNTRLTLTLSVIPDCNYVMMVSDWNCLKYFCLFFYFNHQVSRNFLITLCLHNCVTLNIKNTCGSMRIKCIMYKTLTN
jgi:hypothetical protein